MIDQSINVLILMRREKKAKGNCQLFYWFNVVRRMIRNKMYKR